MTWLMIQHYKKNSLSLESQVFYDLHGNHFNQKLNKGVRRQARNFGLSGVSINYKLTLRCFKMLVNPSRRMPCNKVVEPQNKLINHY